MSSGKKMKICHVITRMIVGGAQENTLYTILGHLRRGHEVVLVTGPSPGREGKLLQNVDFPPFETVELPSLVRELDPANDLKAYFALKKFFRERKFDIVHTHSSKAGVIGLTKSIARELAARNVTANAVAPGFIATDMTDALSEKQREAIVGRIASKRLGEPEDVAKLVRFLASEDAGYITGQVICIDGGMSL